MQGQSYQDKFSDIMVGIARIVRAIQTRVLIIPSTKGLYIMFIIYIIFLY